MKLPPLIIAVLLWTIVVLQIIYIDPQLLTPYFLIPFWISLWSAVTWSIWLIFQKAHRGIIYGSAFTIYLILRYFNLGHYIFLFFLLALVGTIDWYLSRS